LVSFFLFSLLTPAMGTLSLIIVVPVLCVFVFVAFGSYNGRSTEVYLSKMINYFFKPKQLKYQRKPYIEDLDKKLAEWELY
jgi:hypothetical protein